MREQEPRAAFYEAAEKRYAEILATGRSISWSAMRRYLEDRVAGKNPTPPKTETDIRAIK